METKDYFGLRFKQLSCAFENTLQRVAARYELTASQACMLIYLSRAEHKVNQRELEKYFQLSNPTVTGLMKRMEAKGFVDRAISQEDGRFKYITLTPKAVKISAQVAEDLTKLEEQVRTGMTPEEVELFLSLLNRALQNVHGCCMDKCENKNE